MKREAFLKSAFFRQLKQQAPELMVFQLATAGAPDRLIVGNGKTTFWECKHGTPTFALNGRQDLCCKRLADSAYCRYVVWLEDRYGSNKRTLIVHPYYIQQVLCGGGADDWSLGFNHQWLVKYIKQIHETDNC